jgi:hypothetical protein
MIWPDFCCPQLRDAVQDPDIPITYSPRFREFGIRVLDGGSSAILLLFCPWSGTKFPDSLRDAWFEELARRGVDPHGDNIPEEFLDARWYAKNLKGKEEQRSQLGNEGATGDGERRGTDEKYPVERRVENRGTDRTNS